MIKNIIVTCAILAVLLGRASVNAAVISITTHTTWQNGDLILRIRNDGDEPAYSVQPQVYIGDDEYTTDVQQRLDPANSFRTSIRPDLAGKRGTYPAVIVIGYADANGAQFSAAVVTPIWTDQFRRTEVTGQGEEVNLRRKGRLCTTLLNGSEKLISGTCRLILPRELITKEDAKKIEIGPLKKEKICFSIENFSGLSGSIYPVPLLLEYTNSEGDHRFFSMPVIVRIDQARGFHTTPAIFTAAAVLGVVFVFGLFVIVRRQNA